MPAVRDEKGRFVKTKVDVIPETDRVEKAAEKAAFENLRHAAFSIAKTAKGSIKKSKEPADPGEPPHTRGQGGQNIRGAIFTAATKEDAIIGPRGSRVGDVGEAHEFGKSRKGDTFEERAFMGPALEAQVDRFASDWRGTIGE